MSVPVIAFFNNKGGVGKTSLVYHLAWMLGELRMAVLAADLDAQGNLSAAFLEEDRLEELWDGPRTASTIHRAISPLLRGVGDVASPCLQPIAERLWLLPGDLALAAAEDQLSETWPKCLDGDERAFRVTSAFWRVMQNGAAGSGASVILVDLGPNLGAINRAALIAADYVVVPLSPDLFSLQGLKNLGPTLRKWRDGWAERRSRTPDADLPLPEGAMAPLGYVVMQHSVRRGRPVRAYDRWIAAISAVYSEAVMGDRSASPSQGDDPNRIGTLKHYRSLAPLAQEARKPMFFLKPADGALGAHQSAVHEAYLDFKRLAVEIIRRARMDPPPPAS